jgi:hypothetical protein
MDLGQTKRAKELLTHVEALPRSEIPVGVRGHAARFRALLASPSEYTGAVEPEFRAAEKTVEEIGTIFDLAVVRLEHAEWLAGQGDQIRARELFDQARATLERLRATPWLERADRIGLAEAAGGV